MINIELFRYYVTKDVTLGVMKVPGLNKPIYTLERGWNDNKKMVSCISCGNYIIQKHTSPKFGDCFWLPVVLGRSEILIHAGNITNDTTGCLLVGLYSGFINGEYQVLNSKKALSMLLGHIKGDTAELTIKQV